MKRFFALILAALLAFSAAGCAAFGKKEEAPAEAPAAAAEPAEEPAAEEPAEEASQVPDEEAAHEAQVREEFSRRLDSLIALCKDWDGSLDSSFRALGELADLLSFMGENIRDSFDSEELEETVRESLSRLDETDLDKFRTKWSSLKEKLNGLMEDGGGIPLPLIPNKIRQLAESQELQDTFSELSQAVDSALEELGKH